MLQTLYYWRARCSEQQLSAFEVALAAVCQDSISQKTLQTRYDGRYHCALLNQKTLLMAIRTKGKGHIINAKTKYKTAGEAFARDMARFNGIIAYDGFTTAQQTVFLTLQNRGVVFLHHGHVCMPAEFVLILKNNLKEDAWVSLCAKLPKLLLQHISIPSTADFIVNEPHIHHEMAAPLLCQGLLSLESISVQQDLDEKDQDFLCYLEMQGSISCIKLLQRFCPDVIDTKQLHARLPSQSQTSGRQNKSALESALETYFPTRLKKLIQLGLIGLIIKNHTQSKTQIILSLEGREVLAPLLKNAQKRLVEQEKDTWIVSDCEIGVPSPWLHEHDLWRIWIALHFITLHRSKQGLLYKNELKKLAKILHLDRNPPLDMAVSCLLKSNFLREEDQGIFPATINWEEWEKRQLNFIINWKAGKAEQQMVAQLLLELPVKKWLKLQHVKTWLKANSKEHDILSNVPWDRLFTNFYSISLYHIDSSGQCIYLLPVFRAVLSGEVMRSGQTPFQSPGWKGSEASASRSGFINAAGDIQLPPEFSHTTLKTLIDFCTLSSVEHQITLCINPKEISRTKRTREQISECKVLLESIQSPLPQAVEYMFDKQLNLQSMARIEATSLMIMLRNPADAKRMQSLGFSIRQPFSDLPQVMLLEDGIHGHDFIAACLKAGIVLDTGTPPKQWVEGSDNIFDWIHAHNWKTGDWLELCYQQQHNDMLQATVRLEPCHYALKVRHIIENKAGSPVLSPTTTLIETRKISRLRKLKKIEIKQRNMDKLS